MQLSSYKYLLPLFALSFLIGCAKPLANFSTEQLSTTVPAKIKLENTSKNAEAYRWEFGDGNASEEMTPTHTYVESGKYTITLVATKGKKKAIAKQIINVGATSKCLVELTTDFGIMIIELSDETPVHRDNFLKLVEEEFFEDLLFHRVINGFVIQGGDPDSRNAKANTNIGGGGPGYLLPAEFRESMGHVKGALAAASPPNDPEQRSSGSQFYIVDGRPVSASDLDRNEARRDMHYSPALKKEYLANGGLPHLDGGYTVFGKIISGLEIIDKIASVETDGDPPNGQSRPVKDVKMSIRVIE